MFPPTAEAIAIRPDAWLAEVLGYPVFAVEPDFHAADHPGERALWFAKVDVTDPGAVTRLEDQGFRVVDVNVTLSHSGAAPVPGSAVEVGPAAPAEHEELIALAGRCFRYSRFHLDPEIPDVAADRIKREWVRSYTEGSRGVELLAAREGDRAVGFLAVLEGDDARVIDLVGVDPEAQGRGVGAALVAAFVERHRDAAAELRVGTQIANLPSLRLYARSGFGVWGASYVLHRHAGTP
jgi:GNAT superfamily N-acetyltransferase